MSSDCLSLQGSQSCDNYANFAISLKAVSADSTAFQLGFGSVSNLTAFDTWITTSASSSSGFIFSSLNKGGNCTGLLPATTPLRYAASYMCTRAVILDSTPNITITSTSSYCPQNTATLPPPLCPEACLGFASSYVGVISDKKLCADVTEQFVETVKANLNEFCSVIASNYKYTDSKCSPGTTADANSCGFGLTKIKDAQAYCATASNSNDPCCSRLPATTTASAAPSGTNTGPVATTTASAAASSGSSSIFMNPAVIGAACGVIVALLGAIIFGVVSYHRKKQKKAEALAQARLDRLESSVRGGSSYGGGHNRGSSISSIGRANTTTTDDPSLLASYHKDVLGKGVSMDGGSVPSTLQQQQSNSFTTVFNPAQTSPQLVMQQNAAASIYSVAPSSAIVPQPYLAPVEMAPVMQQPEYASAVWTAIAIHEPLHEDELRVRVGDSVVLETIFNDGWARGTNQNTKEYGFIPMAVLQVAPNNNGSGAAPFVSTLSRRG